MGSQISPSDQPIIPKTPISSKSSTHSYTFTSSTAQKQKPTPAVRVNSHPCKGITVSTGEPCKRSVRSNNDFCYQHGNQNQMAGKNIFTPKKNSSKKESNYSKDDEVIDLTNDSPQNDRQEKLDEIEDRMKSLSLNSQSTPDDSNSARAIANDLARKKKGNNDVGSTEELSKKSTRVSIDNRELTPPPIRSDREKVEYVDDNFTNNELFILTPSNEHKTPTRRMLSSYVNTSYELHNKNDTTPRNQIIDLTGDSPPPSSPNTCQGHIKKGKICNNRIKLSERFCHKHKKEEFIESLEEELETPILDPGRSRLKWIRYGEWIKIDLSPEIKRSLRLEMEKPIADKDEPGFIYAYRLLEGPNSENNSQYTLYKVGRTTNVHRRLYQWAKKCGYKLELIEGFPNVDILSTSSFQETFLNDREEAEAETSSLNLGSQPELLTRCKYTHRAERLIHIELGARFKADIEKCNCGDLHREWFKACSQTLDNSNSNVMHRWDEVRKVITHWISYVERVYGVG